MNADACFFAALLRGQGSPRGLSKLNRDHLAADWQKVYDYVLVHVRQHGALPFAETVEMDCGVVLGAAPEGLDYYAGRIRENALRVLMEEGFIASVATPLQEGRALEGLAGAKQVVSQAQRAFRQDIGSSTLDYQVNTLLRLQDYELRGRAVDAQGFPTPFASLTRATGGLLPGEMWAILSRPNVGKTWVMILIAVLLYQYGLRVLFVSMEAPGQAKLPRDQRHRLVKGRCIRCSLTGVSREDGCMGAQVNRQQLSIRFDALGARVSAWRLLRGCLTPQEREVFEYYLRCVHDPVSNGFDWGSLRIVSPPDVRDLTGVELEVMDFQPDVVLWDSAYLGADRSNGERKDAYDDLLKGFNDMLELHSIPGVVSWHLKREVKETAESASLSDAANTDEMSRLVDVAVGLFRPPALLDAREAILRTLKVRDGVAMPELKIHFDVKSKVDFSEIAVAEDGMAQQRRG